MLDMHRVAARLGCQSAMIGTRWANSCPSCMDRLRKRYGWNGDMVVKGMYRLKLVSSEKIQGLIEVLNVLSRFGLGWCPSLVVSSITQ